MGYTSILRKHFLEVERLLQGLPSIEEVASGRVEKDSKKKFITDLLQEDKRKNSKLLAKNQDIQQLKEQAT
jgi:hypothetical protein